MRKGDKRIVFMGSVVSAIWPYCPVEHLFVRVILLVLLVTACVLK